MTLPWAKKLDFHLPCSKLSLAKDNPEKDFIGANRGGFRVVLTVVPHHFFWQRRRSAGMTRKMAGSGHALVGSLKTSQSLLDRIE